MMALYMTTYNHKPLNHYDNQLAI